MDQKNKSYMKLLCKVCFAFNLDLKYFFGRVCGMGGWLEIRKVKLISTQVLVFVEVGVELGNSFQTETELMWLIIQRLYL